MSAMTEDIRTQIRIELARRRWSQARLAEETSITPQHMSLILAGKAANLHDSWQRILGVLDLELTVTPKGG